jgi:hypothetical protein
MRTVPLSAALVFTLVLLAGCVSVSTPTATPVPATPVPPTVAVPTATPTVEIPTPTVEPTLTYTDTEAGFALDYPMAWTILPISPEAKAGSFIYSTTLMSWQPDEGGGGGMPAGQTKVDITLIKSNVTSLEAGVAERKAMLGSGEVETTIKSEETVTLPGGLPALRWELESPFGSSVEYIVPVKGNIVLLSGLGDAGLFDRIAQTLRVIE